MSANPPATTVPSGPTATDVMTAVVAPTAPRPIVGLADQRRPSAEAHARGSEAVGIRPDRDESVADRGDGRHEPVVEGRDIGVRRPSVTVSADEKKAICPVGPPSGVPLSTATTISSGPIAMRDIVADTPGTTTRRPGDPRPGRHRRGR